MDKEDKDNLMKATIELKKLWHNRKKELPRSVKRAVAICLGALWEANYGEENHAFSTVVEIDADEGLIKFPVGFLLKAELEEGDQVCAEVEKDHHGTYIKITKYEEEKDEA